MTPATWKQRVAKFVVLGLGHVPSGREAPKTARPRGLPTGKVLAEIVPKIGELDEFLSQCEDKMGCGPVMNHPFLGPFTVQDWKRFHLLHGEHHLRQISQLRQMQTNNRKS